MPSVASSKSTFDDLSLGMKERWTLLRNRIRFCANGNRTRARQHRRHQLSVTFAVIFSANAYGWAHRAPGGAITEIVRVFHATM